MVSKANWGQIKRAVNVRVEKFHSVRKTYTYVFNTHCVCVCVLATQSHLTLCNSMDCSPPGSSVQGILQARILEWVAILFSKGSSQLRD